MDSKILKTFLLSYQIKKPKNRIIILFTYFSNIKNYFQNLHSKNNLIL